MITDCAGGDAVDIIVAVDDDELFSFNGLSDALASLRNTGNVDSRLIVGDFGTSQQRPLQSRFWRFFQMDIIIISLGRLE